MSQFQPGDRVRGVDRTVPLPDNRPANGTVVYIVARPRGRRSNIATVRWDNGIETASHFFSIEHAEDSCVSALFVGGNLPYSAV